MEIKERDKDEPMKLSLEFFGIPKYIHQIYVSQQKFHSSWAQKENTLLLV